MKPILQDNKPPTIEKQKDYLIHTNEADVSKSCAHVRFFDAHDFFYSQLHAIFCAFISRFSGNVYASGTVCGSSFPLPLPLPPSKQIIDYFVNAQQQLKRGGVGGGGREIIRIKFRKKAKSSRVCHSP